MLLDYLVYLNGVCLYLKIKIEQIKYHIQNFHFFEFFFKKWDLYFYENFWNFPQKISAAILKILDFKTLNKNIQRFIAFDLIFHMVYFFMAREPQTLQKLGWFFFRLFLQFSQTHILDKTISFGDFEFRIDSKVVMGCI